jgi:hypothetical protein
MGRDALALRFAQQDIDAARRLLQSIVYRTNGAQGVVERAIGEDAARLLGTLAARSSAEAAPNAEASRPGAAATAHCETLNERLAQHWRDIANALPFTNKWRRRLLDDLDEAIISRRRHTEWNAAIERAAAVCDEIAAGFDSEWNRRLYVVHHAIRALTKTDGEPT